MVIGFSSPLKNLASMLWWYHKENIHDSWCSIKTSSFPPV